MAAVNVAQEQVLRLAEVQDGGQTRVLLTGSWTLSYFIAAKNLPERLRKLAGGPDCNWDLTGVTVLDSFSALQLWRAWGEKLPASVQARPEHLRLLQGWQHWQAPPPAPRRSFSQELERLARRLGGDFFGQLLSVLTLLGQLALDFSYLCGHPKAMPWPEIANTIYDAGVKALGITALVGFLIGIVISYLSALQLKMFGGEIFIINILGLSIIRELGPLLAAILVAGRSGSAMTAQIGIMRVTEELDALSALGISHSLRLVLPKVCALAVVLPLLTVWTDAAALAGGILSARGILDIGYQQFLLKLPEAVPLDNVFIGLLKSASFGFLIALLACHFGFRIKPNTESLGDETTSSVVAAITVVIMMDAVFAILFMNVGLPWK